MPEGNRTTISHLSVLFSFPTSFILKKIISPISGQHKDMCFLSY